ncbi:MAG: GTPase [Actinomycetota bacterium]|nr:GTPase [Actinomycetota bacterium]
MSIDAAYHQLLDVCARIESTLPGTPHATRAAAISARLSGPLRVAIAGRLKAGKSTLLNALVGERLAATDAGECTQIVTVYGRGDVYDTRGFGRDGAPLPVGLRRVGEGDDGSWEIDLKGANSSSFDRIEIDWPASVLQQLTLVDTPGLGSLNEAISRRSLDFLLAASDRESDTSGADAVIYLMRHLHALDAEFLGAFLDRRVVGASPVNSVAVLARPDEIAACRDDAMVSADRIARRMEADPVVSALVGSVIPVAGLLAETAATLREREVAALREMAHCSDDELAVLLRSVDDLCDVSRTSLTVETRRELLDRFGLFGLRLAIRAIRSDPSMTSSDLARWLLAHSGLARLRNVITTTFLPRARTLKSHTAVIELDALARAFETLHPVLAADVRRQLERLQVEGVDLAALTVAHLVASGTVALPPAHRAEAERLLLAPEGPMAMVGGVVGEPELLEAIERWRTLGADPRGGPLAVQVCDTIARVYELALAEAG